MSELPDFKEISKHFTDFGENIRSERNGDYPERCLVRYRMGGDEEWKSFWERARHCTSTDHLEKGENYPWKKEDEKGIEEGYAHEYALRRLELILNPSDDNEKDPYEALKGCFRSDKYTYYFNTSTIHYHYESGRVVTVKCPKEERVEVKYPANLMLNGEGTFTCYHPVDVSILEGETESDFNSAFKTPDKPNLVTFDNVGDNTNIVYQKSFWNPRGLEDFPKPYNPADRMEVEMYFNNAPPLDGRNIADFVLQHPNVFVHVKYISITSIGYNRQRLYPYNYFNNNPGFPVFFTPFTEGDWKVLNRQIIHLGEQQLDDCVRKMKDSTISVPQTVSGDGDNDIE